MPQTPYTHPNFLTPSHIRVIVLIAYSLLLFLPTGLLKQHVPQAIAVNIVTPDDIDQPNILPHLLQ
jgi:hypothetical protein